MQDHYYFFKGSLFFWYALHKIRPNPCTTIITFVNACQGNANQCKFIITFSKPVSSVVMSFDKSFKKVARLLIFLYIDYNSHTTYEKHI